MRSIKNDFPIFQNNPDLIYLDNASTLQKPQVVLDAVQQYLSHDYANVHRGNYPLSHRSEELYEQARKTVAKFIHAQDESEVIFTGNSTDSANILARSMLRSGWIQAGDNIILTELEHHANILPWQMVAEQVGAELRRIPVGPDGNLDIQCIQEAVDEKTKIISLSLCSNVTGRVWENEVKELNERLQNSPLVLFDEGETRMAPLLVVDASQYVAHKSLDVSAIGADFCFFTGHKLGALTGIGVLWGKKALLKELKPGKVGGGAVDQVSKEGVTYLGAPDAFEPGTPNVVGAVSLMETIHYIESISLDVFDSPPTPLNEGGELGYNAIESIEQKMIQYCVQEFKKLEEQGALTLLGGIEGERIGVFTFVYHGDLSQLEQVMQAEQIALRTGTHCTHIFHAGLQYDNKKTCRISLRAYNEMSDVEKFFELI